MPFDPAQTRRLDKFLTPTGDSAAITAFNRRTIPAQIEALLERLAGPTNVRNAFRLLADVIDADRELALSLVQELSRLDGKPTLVALVLRNAQAYLTAKEKL